MIAEIETRRGAAVLALEDWLADVRAATTKTQRGRVVADALGDADTLEALADVAFLAPHVWVAAIAEVRELELNARTVRDLEAAVRRLARRVESSSGLPAGFEVAPGFACNSGGVFRTPGDRDPVPVVVHSLAADQITHDVETGAREVGVVWPTGRVAVPLEAFGDSRALVGTLAGAGAAVHARNGRDVAAYLSESVYASRLPVARVSSRLGWSGDHWVGDGIGIADAELAGAMSCRGSLDGWREALPPASTPIAWIALLASIASPLLSQVGANQGYVVDLAGRTSRGKTTALRLAASVWGRPDQRGLLRSWDSTPAYLEAYASTLRHLPVLLDDTKQARRKEQIAGFLYAHAYGQSKGRGKPGTGAQSVGRRNTVRWLSILISTGEARITSYSEDEGARARVLSFEGAPLESGAQAWKIAEVTAENYGHFGPLAIAEFRERRGHYVAAFEAARARWRADLVAAGGAVAGRLADVCAALEVAAGLATACGVAVPDAWQAVARAAALTGARDADRASAALDDLVSDVLSRPVQIQGAAGSDLERRTGAPLVGKIDDHGRLAIRSEYARRYLASNGHDASAVIARWVDAGKVSTGHKLRLAGRAVTHLIVIEPV